MDQITDLADICNLIYRCEMNRVHEFNLMLVGKKALGKSTLVRSLFQGLIKPEVGGASERRLNEYSALLVENGVKLKLRCLETSGYEQHNVQEYVKYIEDQFKTYFRAQRRRTSCNISDTLVHCCLYLIPPHGELRLRQEDLVCMEALHEKVNLVPVIARADGFNPKQLSIFKENIMTDLEARGIKYFQFHFDEKEDEERSKVVKGEAERFPFAVVAAEEPIFENGQSRWVRELMWGSLDINDCKQCDFGSLSKLLVRHCMLNLIDSAHINHYGKFKSELLTTARIKNGENLAAMGLEPHEVKRIMSLI